MRNYLKKPVMFTIGLLSFLLGFWMLSPFPADLWGEELRSMTTATWGAAFIFLYFLALALIGGGFTAVVSSLGNTKASTTES